MFLTFEAFKPFENNLPCFMFLPYSKYMGLGVNEEVSLFLLLHLISPLAKFFPFLQIWIVIDFVLVARKESSNQYPTDLLCWK